MNLTSAEQDLTGSVGFGVDDERQSERMIVRILRRTRVNVIKLSSSGRASTIKLLTDVTNGTTHFKKCKQLVEYQHLHILRDIWWSKF